MKIEAIIVVEGKSDTAKIQQAVQADTIETNGSAINQETLQMLHHAHQKRGIIVFTDPDYAGERIRQIIQQAIPDCQHAFLTKKQAAPSGRQKSVGIEHASVEAIRHALKKVYKRNHCLDKEMDFVTKSDLLKCRLIGQPAAYERRKRLGEMLHIGETNGKQLLKRLAMFHITKEVFYDAVRQIEDIEGD